VTYAEPIERSKAARYFKKMKKVARKFPNELRKSGVLMETRNLATPMPAIVRTPKPYSEKALHLYVMTIAKGFVADTYSI